MKDLLAKEQFIDAILDGDARLRLNESYRLAFRQREFPVRGMYCGAAEGSSTDEPDRAKSLQDDVLAQVKGLLAEVVPSYSFGPPQCWACARKGYLKRDRWKVRKNKSRDMQNQNFPNLI